MLGKADNRLVDRVAALGALLRRPELLAFLPALTLAAFWGGGEQLLILTALGTPLIFAMMGAFHYSSEPARSDRRDGVTGLELRPSLIATLDHILQNHQETGRVTACLVLRLDEADQIIQRHGHAAQTEILRRCGERLVSSLRENDRIVRLDGASFAVALAGVRRADLEAVLQLAARLQEAIAAPIGIDGARIYVTTSVGFCLISRTPERSGLAMLEAAETAADDALHHGPGAIRAYSPEVHKTQSDRSQLRNAIETALESGQIIAHYQPQISTDTGRITGFEALARWQHPTQGLIPPGDFLPELEAAGLSERLAEVMLYNALGALNRWDNEGLKVASVGVNFSREDLRNPKLADKLKWEIDRFDLTPERLSVEILETVVADTDNDMITRTISALAEMGCGIDLDDFGTGHASITNIRRFAVKRLKIDRSFVTRLDEDREQQKIVAAILSMAERLGLDTLAEGVETTGEHAMLAQLGCGHVQGFGIARPMCLDDTITWITQHQAKLATTPRIGHRTG